MSAADLTLIGRTNWNKHKQMKQISSTALDLALLLLKECQQTAVRTLAYVSVQYEHRGALRGIPGSAFPQPEPNATELPSSAPGRPKLTELQASAPSPTPTRAEEHIATTSD